MLLITIIFPNRPVWQVWTIISSDIPQGNLSVGLVEGVLGYSALVPHRIGRFVSVVITEVPPTGPAAGPVTDVTGSPSK